MPMGAVDVVMPAFRAEATVAAAVGSLLAQTHGDWHLYLVADDATDYEAVLGKVGIRDPRIAFHATPSPRSGASAARNVALEAGRSRYAAVLDADDLLEPEKLALGLAALEHAPIVSTALGVVSADLVPLRSVGEGPDRPLPAARHKWVNFSMDSTIVWDRERADARYDPAMPNFNDLDFLLRLWSAGEARAFHLGTPLHTYRKLGTSLSSGEDMTAKMVRAKSVLLARLEAGHYGLPDDAALGVIEFLQVSLRAESSFGAALARRPGLIFEDHLEPLLLSAEASAASTSAR